LYRWKITGFANLDFFDQNILYGLAFSEKPSDNAGFLAYKVNISILAVKLAYSKIYGTKVL